jgi:hypothetical protein
MKMPGADRAIVEPAKVRDYLVSPNHPVGRFKSVFFASLGYSSSNWTLLQEALRRIALSDDARPGLASPYGQKFEVHATLEGPTGRRAAVVTVWILLMRDDFRRFAMKFHTLDTVVLDRDVPEHGLRSGDLGAVVETYDPDGLEVEFVTASGRTQALVTLKEHDVREVRDQDLITVRSVTQGAA